ncbi:MAG: CDP-diacylglycerol--glycerol-3-phosphate 3-phosphatidyltransferase [Bacilli bacterium]
MNLPNKITTFRMGCVLVIAFLLLFPWSNMGINIPVLFNDVDLIYLITFVLFLLASFSDFLDGHIARKYNLVTNYGKFMDPIADKLLVNSLFIILMVKGPFKIPAWITVIMIARDLVVDAIRLLAAEQNIVLAASFWGKLKTVLQMVALSFVLLNGFPFNFISSLAANIFCLVLCSCAAFASLMSGVMYLVKNISVFQDHKKEE